MNDFKKAERLIKNKVIKDQLEKEGVPPEQQFKKTTEFPLKKGDSYQYPEHGLNRGNAFYRTNNMNYGI